MKVPRSPGQRDTIKKQPEAVGFGLLSLSEQMFVRIAMLLLFAWGI
jgi:hypothetical protein